MSETNDLEWGLCDHDLAPEAFRDDDDEAYDEEWDGLRAFYDEGDDEPLEELMARVAVEIKAGREVILPGWELSWPSPEVVVWTTPSGRRRGSILT